MIKKNTLFILGAGASVPYGYPTGRELRSRLIFESSKILSDSKMFNNESIKTNRIKMEKFAKTFNKASDNMIDYFLATNPKHVNIGKVAIFNELLYCENLHGFREGSKESDDDWMMFLFNKMTSGINNQNEYKLFNEGNSVSFIIFNYDRVLEYFFWESLMNKFDLTSKQSNELVMGLDIHHVFGRLPSFDHESISSGNQIFPYQNFGITRSDYKYATENIKTLHERDNIDTSKISQLIGEAHRIFFLGFGFAEENLALLNFEKNINKQTPIYGTCFEFSDRRIKILRRRLATTIKRHYNDYYPSTENNITLLDNKSKKLLEDYL